MLFNDHYFNSLYKISRLLIYFPLSSSPHWDLFFWVYRPLENSFFQFTKLFLDLDSIIFFRFFQQPMNHCTNIARLVFRLFIMPILLDIMPKYLLQKFLHNKIYISPGLICLVRILTFQFIGVLSLYTSPFILQMHVPFI